MPCNIGYKEVARTTIPKPVAKKFRAKVDAPKIDRELLNKIGEEDMVFVDWINNLDILPLLQEGLGRAQNSVKAPDKTTVKINSDGSLDINADYDSDRGKRNLESFTNKLSGRFQMQILGIVAELLDYTIEISQDKNSLVLEGEKSQRSDGRVNRYLKISKNEQGAGEFRFEHFASPEELKREKQKFLALAQKFGIKIALESTEKSGQPIAADAVHEHFLKSKE